MQSYGVPSQLTAHDSHNEGSGITAEVGLERPYGPEEQGVCRETVSLRNVRGYTHKFSLIRQLKNELSKDNNNKHVISDRKRAQDLNSTQRTTGC